MEVLDFWVLLSVGALWSTLIANAQSFKAEQQESVDAFIHNVLKCRNIPGLAISVVRGGETLLARGYGKADVEAGVDATGDTRFCIGSLSKAFTSTVLAALLAENKDRYNWDTPVANILGSGFRFHDSLRTENINIRDLLAHKTGIPMYFQGLLTGFPAHITLKDLVRRIRFLQPTKEIRTAFMYNNYMYGLAGYVSSVIGGGVSWEKLVSDRLFIPLNMTSSGFVDQTPNIENLAYPYVTVNGSFVRIDSHIATGVYPTGAAGSIFSNAKDMSQWLKFHLRGGVDSSGRRLVDKKYLANTQTGEMPQPFKEKDLTKPTYPVEDVSLSYSMGWMNSIYRGYRRIHHTGGISAYSSQLWLFPDIDIGVYANLNGPLDSNSDYGLRSILWYVTDVTLGETPWLNSTTACTFPKPWAQNPTKTNRDQQNVTEYSSLSLNLTTYKGTYHHRAFGNITIYLNKTTNILNMRQGRFGHAVLQHTGEDLFVGRWIGLLWFMSNSDGMNARFKVTFKRNNPEAGFADELRINIDQSLLTSFKRA